jgi:hypothetical protein
MAEKCGLKALPAREPSFHFSFPGWDNRPIPASNRNNDVRKNPRTLSRKGIRPEKILRLKISQSKNFFGTDLTGRILCLSYRQTSFGDKKPHSFYISKKSTGKEKISA